MGKTYSGPRLKKRQVKKRRERKRDYIWFLVVGLFRGFVYYVCCIKYLNPIHIIREKQKKLYYTDEDGRIPFKPRIKDRLIDLFQTDDQRRKKLITWVKTKIPNKNVVNFTTSWNDGIALCALLQSIRPGICPGFQLLKPHNLVNNCRLGIRLAKQCLNIPETMLTPEEMAIPDNNTEKKVFQFILAIKISSEKLSYAPFTDSQQKVQRFSTCNVKGPGLNDGVVGRKVRFNVFISDVFELFKLSINIRGPRNEVYCENIVSLHQSCENSDFKENGLKSLQEKNTDQLEDANGNMFVRVKNIKEYGGNAIYNAILFACQCIGEGSFQMSFIPVSAGIHTLSIKWQDRHVNGSPYKIKVYQPRDLTRRAIKDASDKRHFFDSLSLSSIDEKLHGSIDRDNDTGYVPKLEKIDSVAIDDETIPKRSNKTERFTSRMRKQYTVTKRRVLRKIITKNGEEIVIQESPTPSVSRQSSMSAENSDCTEEEGKTNPTNELLRASPASLTTKVYNKRRLMASERSNSFSPGSSFDSTKNGDKRELSRIDSESLLIKSSSNSGHVDNFKKPSSSPKLLDQIPKDIDSFEKTFTQSIDLCDNFPEEEANLSRLQEDDQHPVQMNGDHCSEMSQNRENTQLQNRHTYITNQSDSVDSSKFSATSSDFSLSSKCEIEGGNVTLGFCDDKPKHHKINKLVQQAATDISSDSTDSSSDGQKSDIHKKCMFFEVNPSFNDKQKQKSDSESPTIKILQSDSLKKSCFYISEKPFTGSQSSSGSGSLQRSLSISSLQGGKTSLFETRSLPLLTKENQSCFSKQPQFSSKEQIANNTVNGGSAFSCNIEERKNSGISIPKHDQKERKHKDMKYDKKSRNRTEINVNILEDHMMEDSKFISMDYKNVLSDISGDEDMFVEGLSQNSDTSDDGFSDYDARRRHSTGKTCHKPALRTASLQETVMRRKDIGKRNGLYRQTSITVKENPTAEAEKTSYEPNMDVIYEENKPLNESVHNFENFMTITSSESKSGNECNNARVQIVVPKPKSEKNTQVVWQEIIKETGYEEPVNIFRRKNKMKSAESKPSIATLSTYLSEEEKRTLSRHESDDVMPLIGRTRSLSLDAGIEQIQETERYHRYQLQEIDVLRSYDLDAWIIQQSENSLHPPVRQSTVDTIDSGIAEENSPGRTQKRVLRNSRRNSYGHQLVCRRPYRGRIDLDPALIESCSSNPESPAIEKENFSPFLTELYNHPRLCRRPYQGIIDLDPALTRSGSIPNSPTTDRGLHIPAFASSRFHVSRSLNPDSGDEESIHDGWSKSRQRLNRDSSFSFSDSEINYDERSRYKLRRLVKRSNYNIRRMNANLETVGKSPNRLSNTNNGNMANMGDNSIQTEVGDYGDRICINVPTLSISPDYRSPSIDELYSGFGISNTNRTALLDHLNVFQNITKQDSLEQPTYDLFKKENVRRYVSDDLYPADSLSDFPITMSESEDSRSPNSPLTFYNTTTGKYLTTLEYYICACPSNDNLSTYVYTPDCNTCLSVDSLAISSDTDSVLMDMEELPRTGSVEAILDIPFINSVNYDDASSSCRVEGSGLSFGQVGMKNNFQVWTENSGNGSLSVDIYGPKRHSVLETSIVYTGDDLYEVVYEVTHPGFYIICVKWSHVAVPDSPFLCKITY